MIQGKRDNNPTAPAAVTGSGDIPDKVFK